MMEFIVGLFAGGLFLAGGFVAGFWVAARLQPEHLPDLSPRYGNARVMDKVAWGPNEDPDAP